jgi:hypothetical protein
VRAELERRREDLPGRARPATGMWGRFDRTWSEFSRTMGEFSRRMQDLTKIIVDLDRMHVDFDRMLLDFDRRLLDFDRMHVDFDRMHVDLDCIHVDLDCMHVDLDCMHVDLAWILWRFDRTRGEFTRITGDFTRVRQAHARSLQDFTGGSAHILAFRTTFPFSGACTCPGELALRRCLPSGPRSSRLRPAQASASLEQGCPLPHLRGGLRWVGHLGPSGRHPLGLFSRPRRKVFPLHRGWGAPTRGPDPGRCIFGGDGVVSGRGDGGAACSGSA